MPAEPDLADRAEPAGVDRVSVRFASDIRHQAEVQVHLLRVEDRDVLLVEDIVDTGLTLNYLLGVPGRVLGDAAPWLELDLGTAREFGGPPRPPLR